MPTEHEFVAAIDKPTKLKPPPANLTMSDKNDEYKIMIITLGGAAMGRSTVMPAWGEQLLLPQEIEDVVAYLKTVLVNKQ